MQQLARLQSLRDSPRPHPRWPLDLEADFRSAQRMSHRGPRTLLFTAHALFIGGAPLYGRHLYRPADPLEPWLSLTLIVAGMALLATALFTWRSADHRATKILQVVCVILSGLGAVLLRDLALRGSLNFPSHMVSVVVVSLMIFGGYAWRRMAIGAACCFLLSALIELRLNPDLPLAGVQSLCLGLMGLATITHVYIQEQIARSAWIDRRYANALARTDALTGLSTRNAFNLDFESRLAQARREKRGIAVLILDVDHFKQVNDTYGHLFGDEVLRAIGGVIVDGFARRPLDMRVRFGGEEMVILWYDIAEAQLAALAEKLLTAIRAIELAEPVGGQRVAITASIGVTSLVPDETTRPLDLLRKADALLYCAKTQGRNRAVIEPYRSL